jgi:DNA-binding PadR family transcriptional regulator
MNKQTADLIYEFLILTTVSTEPMESTRIELLLEQRLRGLLKIAPGSIKNALERLESAGYLYTEWRLTAKFHSLSPAGVKKLETSRSMVQSELKHFIADDGNFRVRKPSADSWN